MSTIALARLLLALASFRGIEVQDTQPLVWTGKLRGANDFFLGSVPLPQEKDSAGYAAQLRRSLAELTTKTDLARDFAKQLPQLDMLRAESCWRIDYPGKAEVAAEIAAKRADWLEKLGKHEEAVFAAWHPFVMPGEKDKKPYENLEWVASNPSIATLVKEIDALPKVIELRNRFPANAPAVQGGDAIEQVVWDAIERGNPQTLREFGTRCVPALQKITLSRKDEENRLNDQEDPLTILLQLDRKAGQAFFLSTLDTRGPIWMLRVIRALNVVGVTQRPWTMSADHSAPPTFDDAQTLQLIDALAAKPMTSEMYFQLLKPLVARDVVSPAVQAYLLGQVQTSNPVLLGSLREMLDGQRVGPNKRALYEAFLDSNDADLRSRCASALSLYPVGAATLRATQHADPNVRANALRALVRHAVWTFDYVANSTPANTPQRWIEVPRTPEIQAALLRLARDPESNVRVELARALQASKEDPPADVLELLLSDPDPAVRQVTAFDWSFKPDLQAHVLERLAADKEEQVQRAVVLALSLRSPGNQLNVSPAESNLYLPALTTWLANARTELMSDSVANPKPALRGALKSAEGARLVFDVCIRGPRKDELAHVLLDSLDWNRGGGNGVGVFGVLDGPGIGELFAAMCKYWDAQAVYPTVDALFRFVARGELDAKPFLDLARDESQVRSTRLRALRIAVSRADETFKNCFLTFVRSATPAELEVNSKSGQELTSLLYQILKEWPDQDQTAAEICVDTKVPDPVALYVVANARRTGALAATSMRACLQRWAHLDAGWRFRDAGIFFVLDPHVEPGVLELWRAHYQDPRLSEGVVSAMRKYPTAESVPMLEDAVSPEWLNMEPNVGPVVRANAITALTERLDDLGADALLKAIASARDDEARKKCFDGLEQIRKYQDEKQSWQRRKGGEAAREQAINDLLPMLSDKDAAIRAAAARSLATLAAAEHLPKLVALLKDKDASVREAAQKALDALNGAATKKP